MIDTAISVEESTMVLRKLVGRSPKSSEVAAYVE